METTIKNKRRLIDCQYFAQTDTVIINEVLNGEKNIIIINKPKFDFYVEPQLKEKKKETKFYKKVEELNKIECSYKDRYLAVANALQLDILNPKAINKDYDFKKQIMANHNLYGADDNIEYRYIRKYYEEYKDEIDESINVNFMFFDIEVHADFNKKVYNEIEKIYDYLHHNIEYKPDLKDIYMKPFEHIMNEEDMDKLKEYILQHTNDVHTNLYIDLRFYVALMNSKAISIDPERVKTYLLKRLTPERKQFFYENLAFPDEEKANNRVDAISFVDTNKRKLYMYLLNIENDLIDDEEKEYIKNTKLVNNQLSNFIELFLIVSYLTNIPNEDKEVCKELLDNLPFLTKKYQELADTKNIEVSKEEKIKVAQFIQLARNTIPNYDKRIKIDVEYTLFNNELEMIRSFFHKIKTEIKPNIMAAHNAKFDVLTLKNRLLKYGVDFNKEINQLTIYDKNKKLHELESTIKIDNLTMEIKKNKTKYTIPGVVLIDTLLLYAKSSSKDRNWSLDSIAQDEIKDSKIPYEFEIFEFYMKDIKKFIKYSAVDTLLLMRLEESIKFIELFQLILNNTKCEWNNYMYNTQHITNLIKYKSYTHESGCYVLRNNLSTFRKEKVAGSVKEVQYQGAYNTPLDLVDTYGLHQNVFDIDFSAYYPSSSITTNIAIETFKFKSDKEIHNDYMFMSKIGLLNKYCNMPSSEEIFNEI